MHLNLHFLIFLNVLKFYMAIVILVFMIILFKFLNLHKNFKCKRSNFNQNFLKFSIIIEI